MKFKKAMSREHTENLTSIKFMAHNFPSFDVLKFPPYSETTSVHLRTLDLATIESCTFCFDWPQLTKCQSEILIDLICVQVVRCNKTEL